MLAYCNNQTALALHEVYESSHYEADKGGSRVKLEFHGSDADTDSDIDTDILADFRARIVARMSACPATSPFSLP